MKPQLTISLLSSKQIHSVRRCLNSLVPILMQIPSELIVVDTSEKKEIRELLLQYTSQVIPFHWCNDFSKARNTGLKLAKGEWFLFLDDDEWFEDPSEIIDFFSSGEYHQYNSGCYIVRNYTDWTGGNYIDAHSSRMTRITPETKFINPIHEYLSPLVNPIKSFSVFVHHYGYAGKSRNDKPARNIPLIKKELKEHEPSVHNYMQLTQEYLVIHKYKEAEEFARKCLALETSCQDLGVSWCVAELPLIVCKQKDYPRAWETGKEMLRHPQCTEIASLRIYSYLTDIGEQLKNHEREVIIYAKAYHQYLDRMDARPEQWFKQSIMSLSEQRIKSVKDIIYFSGLKASITEEDTQAALFFLSCLPWENNNAEKLYPNFCDILRDEKKENFLLSLIENLENTDPFISIIKSRAAWKKGNRDLSEKYLRLAVKSRQIHVLIEAALLVFQSQGELSLEPVLNYTDISQWKNIAAYITEIEEINLLPCRISLAKSYLSDYPVQMLLLLTSFQEKLLIEGILEIENSNLYSEIKQYCQWVRAYTTTIYNENILSANSDSFLPSNYRFALQMEQIFQDLENFDYPKVLKQLHEVINTHRPLCGVIRRILSMIAEEINQPKQENQEFLILAKQVKQMVYALLKENHYEEAKPLIQQLSSLLPKDLEVLRLRQELWIHIGE